MRVKPSSDGANILKGFSANGLKSAPSHHTHRILDYNTFSTFSFFRDNRYKLLVQFERDKVLSGGRKQNYGSRVP